MNGGGAEDSRRLSNSNTITIRTNSKQFELIRSRQTNQPTEELELRMNSEQSLKEGLLVEDEEKQQDDNNQSFMTDEDKQEVSYIKKKIKKMMKDGQAEVRQYENVEPKRQWRRRDSIKESSADIEELLKIGKLRRRNNSEYKKTSTSQDELVGKQKYRMSGRE